MTVIAIPYIINRGKCSIKSVAKDFSYATAPSIE